MPNHIHLIWRTKDLNGKETAQGSFLKHTAHQFMKTILKENAYNEFIKVNNLDYKQVLSVGKGNNMDVVENTTKVFDEFILKDKEFTAVFACNDLMAVGVINSCNNAGIKIPTDLSIIGFDNTLLSSISNPKLTSVDLNIKKVAETAAREIISLAKKNKLSMEKVTFNSRLFLRDSCATPKMAPIIKT